MIVAPTQQDISLFSKDPKSGGAWIMYSGTPYAHVMVPAVLANK
jgi:hypothetical protein